jgi:hypothetical protein
VADEFRTEKDLQDACVRWARTQGWFARRYKGPGRRSHPDYLFAHLSVRRTCFIEFKLPGKEPTPLQYREHREMMAHGMDVLWLDSIEDFKAVLRVRERA